MKYNCYLLVYYFIKKNWKFEILTAMMLTSTCFGRFWGNIIHSKHTKIYIKMYVKLTF